MAHEIGARHNFEWGGVVVEGTRTETTERARARRTGRERRRHNTAAVDSHTAMLAHALPAAAGTAGRCKPLAEHAIPVVDVARRKGYPAPARPFSVLPRGRYSL